MLCALSLCIFCRRSRFLDQTFVYYRLLCLVYIIHLAHNVPYGILFAPHYFPQVNSYTSSLFQIYYNVATNFLYHFEDSLQIAIVLTRMKIFSSFLRQHFTFPSRYVVLSLFLTCLLIDLPVVFTFKINSFGRYFYMNEFGKRINATFYYFESSEFSLSPFGQIILVFTGFFLNLFLTLFISVTLNITYFIQYKTYLEERRSKVEEYRLVSFEVTTSSIATPNLVRARPRETRRLTVKEIDEQNAESNMFWMTLTLCLMSILTRVLFMFAYVFFLFFYSFSNSLLLLIANDLIVAIEMSASIFIFYSFNRIFREELIR